MRPSSPERDRRKQNRMKGVLPVRVRGVDKNGRSFEEIAHTLDIAVVGSRLGAIHHELKVSDRLTVVYRQRRMEFLVVWTRQVGKHEYQVGLQAIKQEKESWGLNSENFEISSHGPAKVSVAGDTREQRGQLLSTV